MLKTSLGTLTRVLEAVDWSKISKGNVDAWLYFYEDFLEVYDNALRKRTGSYYTPPEVVSAMVRLVDEALRKPDLFDRPAGFASSDVTVADPAVGTGTFLLGVFRRIAATVESDQGAGAVPGAVCGRSAAAHRLRASVRSVRGGATAADRRDARADSVRRDSRHSPLHHRHARQSLRRGGAARPRCCSRSRGRGGRRTRSSGASRSLSSSAIRPTRRRPKGRGGWIEEGSEGREAPLDRWMPPRAWGVGAHTKHLKNLYVYFWRWATWKVFGTGLHASTGLEETDKAGVVCFITVAGFLNGPGFEKMRDDLRRSCQEIWVIDCSPEGHQPDVPTRIFQAVQQPVCIVLAARALGKDPERACACAVPCPARRPTRGEVRCFGETVAAGRRMDGLSVRLARPIPARASGAWATFPALKDLLHCMTARA